jgi:hypothetical protein
MGAGTGRASGGRTADIGGVRGSGEPAASVGRVRNG